jgi:hypothetical protein
VPVIPASWEGRGCVSGWLGYQCEDPICKMNKAKGLTQAVEHLLRTFKALSSKPTTNSQKKKIFSGFTEPIYRHQ